MPSDPNDPDRKNSIDPYKLPSNEPTWGLKNSLWDFLDRAMEGLQQINKSKGFNNNNMNGGNNNMNEGKMFEHPGSAGSADDYYKQKLISNEKNFSGDFGQFYNNSSGGN